MPYTNFISTAQSPQSASQLNKLINCFKRPVTSNQYSFKRPQTATNLRNGLKDQLTNITSGQYNLNTDSVL